MLIYAELRRQTSDPEVPLPPEAALGGDAPRTNPCSVMLFHKAALTRGLSRPGIFRRGVWDAYPETCGTNET